jgi:hypothetical protein
MSSPGKERAPMTAAAKAEKLAELDRLIGDLNDDLNRLTPNQFNAQCIADRERELDGLLDKRKLVAGWPVEG